MSWKTLDNLKREIIIGTDVGKPGDFGYPDGGPESARWNEWARDRIGKSSSRVVHAVHNETLYEIWKWDVRGPNRLTGYMMRNIERNDFDAIDLKDSFIHMVYRATADMLADDIRVSDVC